MPRQTWMVDVLADAFRGVKGFRFEVYSSATTRGSTSFDPIGVMNHHTGAGRYDNLLNYMMRGSSIAPLCNWATSRPENGIVRVTMCCAGRANHAGRGGKGRGGTAWIPTDQGNYLTIGGEHQNDGSQPWPEQQLEAIYRGSAALLKHMGEDEDRAALHKTYAPGRKPDMHTEMLSVHQGAIAEYLRPLPKPAPRWRYTMLLMAARGLDFDAASTVVHLTGVRAGLTTHATEAVEAMNAGVKTIYIGGPAVRAALNRDAASLGIVWHRQGQVATVVGETALDTLAHLVLLAKNDWKP